MPMLSQFSDPTRCSAHDDLCRRIQALEPTLPIRPPLLHGRATPCLTDSVCLPGVHILSGWHMLEEDGIKPWFAQHPQVEVRSGGCFNLWRDHNGALQWVESFGSINASMLMATSNCASKQLTWHPEYAGRYFSTAMDLWEACKKENASSSSSGCAKIRQHSAESERLGADPRLAAHSELIGSGGIGKEATPPFVMRHLYGSHVRIITALRSPVDRIETAFWFHKQFWGAKGATARGLNDYAIEQVREFNKCQEAHGVRRCAFLFERLGRSQAGAFWHCNQIIRGLYEPFVAEWRAAFPHELLVVRVEDLFDRFEATGARVQSFLGLSHASRFAPLPVMSYVARHVASLNVSCCGGGRGPPEPMLAETRTLLMDFYRPFNAKLGQMLSEPAFAEWSTSGWGVH